MPNLRKTATAALLVLSSALLPPPATALDPPPPKGEPMRGTWGFSASGTLLPPAVEAPAPVAVVGLITFDPTTRDCSITERVSGGVHNGVDQPDDVAGLVCDESGVHAP
jgi:hypothetical protein